VRGMFNKKILEKVLVFDGAMGTLLFEKGLQPGTCPEWMNIEHSEKVQEIYEAYLNAGADVITTNTFGGNHIKLSEYGLQDCVKEINANGVRIAKKAIGKSNAYVAASVGPTGQFVEPIGRNTFQEIYSVFKEQIEGLVSANPDFIIMETFNDLGEIRAALLAARDVCDLPVICMLTYNGDRTLTGVSPASAAVVLESLGASAIGANCSGGPKELFSVVKELSRYTQLPIIVQPNAGLPILQEETVIYPLGPNEFLEAMEPYFDLGIHLFGSCCGSTPEHTKILKNRLKGFVPALRSIQMESTLASREKVLSIGKSSFPRIVGERINPTSRKKLAESLRKGEWSTIQNEAEKQVRAGAHLLDVNVGTHGIDPEVTMHSVINLLQQTISVPLVIDSTNPDVIEKALETYHGKALVNSVNGEENHLNSILPIIKRYGAGVIGLTLDEKGIPSKAEERYQIAEKIVQKCIAYGIAKQDIYIDSLVLTIGTDEGSALETLKTLKRVKKELGVHTILGISNISHGLPNRNKINGAFLAMAIANGLDLAIINPLDEMMMDIWEAASLLAGRDRNALNYIERNGKKDKREDIKKISQENVYEQPSLTKIKDLVIQGSYDVNIVVKALLQQGIQPLEIINKGLIPGLDEVGDKFEKGEYFLPQLMLSAEIAEQVFHHIEKFLGTDREVLSKSTVVIGTVKGDIHDIGKNMVAVMLKTHGYKVVDLGKNVSRETFLEAAKKEKAEFVGLSALMTTTMVEIPKTIEYIKKYLPNIKIIVGGAVVTEEYAIQSGADGYSQDAVGAVKLVEELKQRGI
jgi:5-methyltetrahydrofolate--homocysteine methyltransferase